MEMNRAAGVIAEQPCKHLGTDKASEPGLSPTIQMRQQPQIHSPIDTRLPVTVLAPPRAASDAGCLIAALPYKKATRRALFLARGF
jgi:hypothetical protein